MRASTPGTAAAPFDAGLLALGDFHNVSTAHSTTYGTACSSSEDGGEHADGGGKSCIRSSSSDGSASQGFPESGAEAAQPATPGAAGGAAASAAEDSAEGMPDLHLAHELALSCYELYRRTPSGLAPEIAHFADNSGESPGPAAGTAVEKPLCAACMAGGRRCLTASMQGRFQWVDNRPAAGGRTWRG